jgi:hypothetical protein
VYRWILASLLADKNVVVEEMVTLAGLEMVTVSSDVEMVMAMEIASFQAITIASARFFRLEKIHAHESVIEDRPFCDSILRTGFALPNTWYGYA